jgi:MYXO-CTERM domain-containing protein
MRHFGAIVVAVALCATPTLADWSDNFDSYDTGVSVHGLGGWTGWQGDAGATAYTSDTMAYSAPNSLDVNTTSDLVQQYSGYTSGQWTYKAKQYIPDDFTGESYFILLNTYDLHTSTFNWSVQIRFDADDEIVESEFESAQLPLITGQWVEVRAEIDLDADTLDLYYDGQLLSSKVWTDGVTGDGALNIAAVDLYANGASPIYYDDMALTPEPASLGLLVLAGLVALRRR